MVAWISSPTYDYYVEYWCEVKGHQNVIVQASGPIHAQEIMSHYKVENVTLLEGKENG